MEGGSQIVTSTLQTLRRQTITKESSITPNELDNLRYLLNEFHKFHENLSFDYSANEQQLPFSQIHLTGSRKRKHNSEISNDIQQSLQYLANTIIDADDSMRSYPPPKYSNRQHNINTNVDNSKTTDFSVTTLLASQAPSPPQQRPPTKKTPKLRKPHKGVHILTSDKINPLQVPRSIQVSKDEYGRAIYFISGEQIRFKVPKNKPKNGAFLKQWEQAFESLCEYQKLYGHTNVTRSTPGWESLGSWVNEQRRKLKLGKVEDAQFQRLNEIGFEWDRTFYGEEAPTYSTAQKQPVVPNLPFLKEKYPSEKSEIVEGDN